MFDGKFTVNSETGCWEWNKNYLLYPKVQFRGKITRIHRASYMWYKGDIPKGRCVLHKCDNKQCMNPDHLFLGSQADNMKDMNNKGRGNYNKSNEHKISLSIANRKTSKEQIDKAKQLRKEGSSYNDIAKALNCYPSHARSICLDLYKYASVTNG